MIGNTFRGMSVFEKLYQTNQIFCRKSLCERPQFVPAGPSGKGRENIAWLQLGISKLFRLYISSFGRNIIQPWDENIAGNNKRRKEPQRRPDQETEN